MASMHRLLLAALLAFPLLACSRAPDTAAFEEAAAPAVGPGVASAQAPLGTQRKLVRKATLQLVVEDVAAVRTRCEALAVQRGGFVQSVEANKYAGTQHVRLVLRVPKDQLDAVLTGLRALGAVQSEQQDVDDVTQKYVDVDARLRNMSRTEQRLLGLLDDRASGLGDVLAVERELARVREEHETLSAQMRALEEQIGLSTITLELTQEGVFEPPPSLWTPLARLWRDAGAVLVESVAALVAFAAALVRWVLYALPWLPVAALALYLTRRIVRWRRRRAER
jgi:hypothetical protein